MSELLRSARPEFTEAPEVRSVQETVFQRVLDANRAVMAEHLRLSEAAATMQRSYSPVSSAEQMLIHLQLSDVAYQEAYARLVAANQLVASGHEYGFTEQLLSPEPEVPPAQ